MGLIHCFFIALSCGTLIASSKIEKCLDTGLDSEFQCSQRIVLSLAVGGSLGSGDGNASSSLQATVDSVQSADGSGRRLESPLTVQVVRAEHSGRLYPLRALQTVDEKPYEIITGRTLVQWCGVDSCPVQYKDAAGTRVPYSEGFCCGADFFSGGPMRNGIAGNLFGQQFTHSCLGFSGKRWLALSIAEAQISSPILVSIVYRNAETGLFDKDNLVIDAEAPVKVSSTGLLQAELIGDFSPYKSGPVLTNHILFVKQREDGFFEITNTSLLLPFNLVDLSGRTPNKVGVSFHGFFSTPNPCGSRFGSGLDGQLADFYRSDLDRINRGLEPQYFASRYGLRFEQLQVDQEQQYFIGIPQKFPVNSLVTLTVKADNIRFVENVSPGKILEAYVDAFETLAVSGLLRALVMNTGRILATYYVEVGECSDNILPVIAQNLDIAPQKSVTLAFQLETTTLLGRNSVCTVFLKDSQFSIVDRLLVYFNTTDTILSSGAQDANGTGNGNSTEVGSFAEQACKDCSYFDITCQIANGCIGDILKGAGTIALPAIGLLILLKVLSSRSARMALSNCCCPARRRRVEYVETRESRVVRPRAPQAAKSRPNGLLTLANK